MSIMTDIDEIIADLMDGELDAEGDVDMRAAAQRIDDALLDRYADEYVAWMRARSVVKMHADLADLNRHRRAQARRRAKAQPFRDAASAIEAGADGHGVLEEWRCDVGNGIQRPIGKMTADDNRFVAASYRQRADRNRLIAAFHEHVARRQGAKLVEEVFDDDKPARHR